MNSLENLGEVISTDVLIVSGGLSGLVAALKAKEENVDVLVVDKATIGYAGQAHRAGHGWLCTTPTQSDEKFVEHWTRTYGDYLVDQEYMKKYYSIAYKVYEQCAEWGMEVPRTSDGQIVVPPHFCGSLYSMAIPDLEITQHVAKKAKSLGVKFLNKTHISDLLTDGDTVVGAVGFNVEDGKFYIFKAKSVVTGTGGCTFNTTKMFNGRGEGPAMAWRAGAEMRNCEYGNFMDVWGTENNETVVTALSVCNRLGENLYDKYDLPKYSLDVTPHIIVAMEKEVLEGRGPCHVDLRGAFDKLPHAYGQDAFLPFLFGMHGSKRQALDEIVKEKDDRMGVVPILNPTVTVSLHGQAGYTKVDHDMRASLNGLFAVGSDIHNGSSWLGATPAPGIRSTGVSNAAITGYIGGTPAGQFAAANKQGKIDAAQVEQRKNELFAPLSCKNGIAPSEVIYDIHQVVAPVRYMVNRSKDRLEEALGKVDNIKDKLPALQASDPHGVGKCLEARAIALHPELMFTSALLRTESRGWHIREDYPERDDENWVKWITLFKKDGKIAHRIDPIPEESYKIKP